MFKPHYGHCTICQDEDKRFIVVAHPPMCDRCNRLKKAKAVLRQVPARKGAKKSTGEKAMFLKIWSVREHQCTHCKMWLGEEPLAQFFAHTVRKSKDNSLRLNPDNVQLMCLECHMAMDQGSKEQFDKLFKP